MSLIVIFRNKSDSWIREKVSMLMEKDKPNVSTDLDGIPLDSDETTFGTAHDSHRPVMAGVAIISHGRVTGSIGAHNGQRVSNYTGIINPRYSC